VLAYDTLAPPQKKNLVRVYVNGETLENKAKNKQAETLKTKPAVST
jgi:hypothetical protein